MGGSEQKWRKIIESKSSFCYQQPAQPFHLLRWKFPSKSSYITTYFSVTFFVIQGRKKFHNHRKGYQFLTHKLSLTFLRIYDFFALCLWFHYAIFFLFFSITKWTILTIAANRYVSVTKTQEEPNNNFSNRECLTDISMGSLFTEHEQNWNWESFSLTRICQGFAFFETLWKALSARRMFSYDSFTLYCSMLVWIAAG